MPHGRVAGYERYSDAERAHRPCHQVWGASSDSQAAEDEEAVDGQGAGFAEVMSNITLAMWRAVCGWEDGRVRGWTGPLSKSFRVCAYISRIKRYLDTIRYDTIRYDTIRYDTIGEETLSVYVVCGWYGHHACIDM
jgi:hypothetical protein